MALAVVLGLIFLLRWLGRRFTGHSGSGHGRAVQVVSRSLIAPRQQLMLVRIGRRLVLVGNSGTVMNPLCEITDADEVAEVLGQVQQEKGESISRTFGSLFRREEDKFNQQVPSASQSPVDSFPDEHDRDIDPDSAPGTSRQELNELLDTVRGMTKNFKKPS